jgi:hypothetical protein
MPLDWGSTRPSSPQYSGTSLRCQRVGADHHFFFCGDRLRQFLRHKRRIEAENQRGDAGDYFYFHDISSLVVDFIEAFDTAY